MPRKSTQCARRVGIAIISTASRCMAATAMHHARRMVATACIRAGAAGWKRGRWWPRPCIMPAA